APNGAGCYAVSSGDTGPALIALGATARVVSRRGVRVVPIAELYGDDGIHPVHLEADEVLTELTLPRLAAGWRSAYEKYRVRGAFDFPIASVAVAARFDGDVCAAVQLVLQGLATRPVSVPEAETLLSGQTWTKEVIEAAGESAYHAAHPMDNTAGAIALRRRMVRALTQRALERMCEERR